MSESQTLKRHLGLPLDATLDQCMEAINTLKYHQDEYLRYRTYAEYQRFENGNEDESVYFWSPDEENYIDSLASSLAVVIRADDLRQLVGGQNEWKNPAVELPEPVNDFENYSDEVWVAHVLHGEPEVDKDRYCWKAKSFWMCGEHHVTAWKHIRKPQPFTGTFETEGAQSE